MSHILCTNIWQTVLTAFFCATHAQFLPPTISDNKWLTFLVIGRGAGRDFNLEGNNYRAAVGHVILIMIAQTTYWSHTLSTEWIVSTEYSELHISFLHMEWFSWWLFFSLEAWKVGRNILCYIPLSSKSGGHFPSPPRVLCPCMCPCPHPVSPWLLDVFYSRRRHGNILGIKSQIGFTLIWYHCQPRLYFTIDQSDQEVARRLLQPVVQIFLKRYGEVGTCSEIKQKYCKKFKKKVLKVSKELKGKIWNIALKLETSTSSVLLLIDLFFLPFPQTSSIFKGALRCLKTYFNLLHESNKLVEGVCMVTLNLWDTKFSGLFTGLLHICLTEISFWEWGVSQDEEYSSRAWHDWWHRQQKAVVPSMFDEVPLKNTHTLWLRHALFVPLMFDEVPLKNTHSLWLRQALFILRSMPGHLSVPYIPSSTLKLHYRVTQQSWEIPFHSSFARTFLFDDLFTFTHAVPCMRQVIW